MSGAAAAAADAADAAGWADPSARGADDDAIGATAASELLAAMIAEVDAAAAAASGCAIADRCGELLMSSGDAGCGGGGGNICRCGGG